MGDRMDSSDHSYTIYRQISEQNLKWKLDITYLGITHDIFLVKI